MDYVAYFKFGTTAPKPRGEWDVVAQSICVAGIEKHGREVRAFCRAVERAEAEKRSYGLTLVRQPHLRGTTEAIAVYGFAEGKGLFGIARRRWHIGYVPGIVARKVDPGGTHNSEELGAELQAIYSGLGDFCEIRMSLLVPRLAMRLAA